MTNPGASILQRSHELAWGKARSGLYCLLTLIVIFLQCSNIVTSVLYAEGHLSL